MKLTKLLSLLMLVGIIFSCTNEELTIEETGIEENADLVLDLGTYADSSLGMYKGVFSTIDSQDRGTVEIKIINEETSKASITYLNGNIEYFNGIVQQQTGLTTYDGMSIIFNSITSRNSSFVFSVEADGSTPTITDANSNSRASLITVVKENTRGAVIPLTGMFTSSIGNTGVWNIIFNTGTGEGTDTDITTQTLFDGLDFGSTTGNEQSGCAALPSADGTSCTIGGSYTSLGVGIEWAGVHTYLGAEDCSQVSGTWTATGMTSVSSGTFISDIVCNVCTGMIDTFDGAIGDIADNSCEFVGNAFPVDVTATGTIGVDADIDNITIDITHTWISDLDVFIISPAGTALTLTTAIGDDGDDHTNTIFRDGGDDITLASPPFTGVFAPQTGTFADTFAGESITGTWVLGACDFAAGDAGTLNSWSIGFCDQNVLFAPSSENNDETTRSTTSNEKDIEAIFNNKTALHSGRSIKEKRKE